MTDDADTDDDVTVTTDDVTDDGDVTVCDYESDDEGSFISYEVDCGCQEGEKEEEEGVMVEEPDACAYEEPCLMGACDPFDNGVENGDRYVDQDPLTVRPSEYESPFAADPEAEEPPPEDLPEEVEVVLADGEDPSKVDEKEVPDDFQDLDNEVNVVGSQEFGVVEVQDGDVVLDEVGGYKRGEGEDFEYPPSKRTRYGEDEEDVVIEDIDVVIENSGYKRDVEDSGFDYPSSKDVVIEEDDVWTDLGNYAYVVGS